jgi:acetyl-CoA decarbonylase/synthase complex subunit gamma
MVKRASPLDIYKLLDKSNCKDCGYDTCMAFATDLLERKIRLSDCTHLQRPKQAKNLQKLIELTTPPQKPVEFGVGERACIIGGEEVMFRHSLTFYNEMAIAITVDDNAEDLVDTVKYLSNVLISRLGDDLRLNAIALKCVSNDAEAFKVAAKKVVENSDMPVVLCCFNPDILLAAAAEIKAQKPLLYAATKESWEKIGSFAFDEDLPVVCFSNDINELVSISASLQKLGVREIALDPGTYFGEGNVAETFNKILQLRFAGIEGEDQNSGWPIIGVPAAFWKNVNIKNEKDLWKLQYKEMIMACILGAIDTSMIICHTGKRKEDIWALLAILTFRQNVFADPRIYPAVDPGLEVIGEPKGDAPIFCTTNYRMTVYPVREDIRAGNIDAYLLAVDTGGIGVESAVAGGQYSSSAIAEAIEKFKPFEKVDHRIIVIPGMAARLSGAIEDDANCVAIVGPRDSSGISDFMKARWDPEKDMKEFNERE